MNKYVGHIHLGYLGVMSEVIIGLANYWIVGIIIYFIQKSEWKSFNRILWSFAALFAVTGSKQICSIWTLQNENYWFEEVALAITALIFLWENVKLFSGITKMRDLPSVKDLEKNNQKLVRDFTECKQVEFSLRLSQAKLDDILNSVDVSIVCLRVFSDFSWKYEYLSKGSEAIFGYTGEEISGDKNFLMPQILPEDAENLMTSLFKEIFAERPAKVKYRFKHKDGTVRWICANYISRRDEEANCWIVTGVSTDITKRKEAEEQQLRTSAILSTAERLARVGSWEIDLQTQNITWSKEMYRIYGFNANSFKPTKMTFLQIVHHKDRSRIEQITQQAILKGISYEVQFRIIRPDGLIRYLESRGEPIFDAQGKVIKLVGAVQDITQRKQVEKERLRLVAILEASTDHISMINAEGNPLWSNAQAKKIVGLPLGTDTTRVPISHYHPGWALKIIEEQGFPTAISQGSWVGETALLRGDGSEMAVSQMIISHKSPDGRVEYFSTIMRDISESKQQKAELEEAKEAAEAANRAKSEFIARMSHELRTPLNSILGFTQLMHGDSYCLAQHRQYLDIINKSGQHLLALINDVLEMSKIEAGRLKLHKNSFDLYHLLNNLEQMLWLKATAKQISLTFELAPDIPQYIITDESKLRQVLLNLIGNAIKFTQRGSVKLQVTTGDKDNVLKFEVKDTGTGIASEEINNLFNPFVQTESGRISQEGTGLGLPISQKFVQLMGGDISVNSTVERGSVFAFDIQYKLADKIHTQTQASQKRVKGLISNQPTYRLLIVDDAWEHRQFLFRLLTSVGFEVQEAENGKDAIDLWQSWQPHLIFMDMQMPVMNGYEATEQIKATIKGQATIIVALTASALDNERSIILSSGCDSFISKPFRPEDIFDKLTQHLGVSYIYSDSTVVAASTPLSNINLTNKDLEVMPEEWLQKLHEAACCCSDERVFLLLEQIAEEHTNLSFALQELAYNFRFDKIIEITS